MKAFISLILIAAALGIFFIFTDPQYQEVKKLQIQSVNYNQALNQSKALLAQRDNLQKVYANIDPSALDRIKRLAPNSIDNVRLIIDISGIASKRNLVIKSIHLTDSASTKQSVIGPDTNPYGSVTLSFNVIANYNDFKLLLADLENSLRIVDITALSFTPTDKSDQVYDYQVSLKTYWLKQ